MPSGTIFPKAVKDAPVQPTRSTGLFVLKPAASNAKLGNGRNVFTKGRYVGMPLFALTLEERATCPSTCDRWRDCYANAMPFATRYTVNAQLFQALRADVKLLAGKHPRGFCVRLHVAGDYPSVLYVELWRELLTRHAELHIFSYTHREPGTPVGDAVTLLVQDFPERVSVLRSNGQAGDPLPLAIVVDKHSSQPAPGTQVICPEQTGRAASCLDCGLCTLGRIGVSFLNHGRALREAA